MKKISKTLIGIQALILTFVIAVPAQAALNVGAPIQLYGSVVTIKSPYSQTPSYYTPTAPTPVKVTPTTPSEPATPSPTTPSTPTPTTPTEPTTPTTVTQKPSSVISLKDYFNWNRTPAPAPAPAPAPTPEPTPAPTPEPTPAPTPAPAPAPAPEPTPAPTQPAPVPTKPSIPIISSITAEEQLMVDMVNKERAAAGLQPLKVELRLASVARAKAIDLKENNYFAHQSPTYGSPFDMMKQVGLTYRYAGENLAMNRTVAAAMTALMQSPGHKANILNPDFTHIGIGISYGSSANYYVQEFIQQ